MITVKEAATISLTKITIPAQGENSEAQEQTAFNAGRLPLVWYNGILFDSNNIQMLHIDGSGWLPRMSITFRDSTGMMINQAFPTDDVIIAIFIKSMIPSIMPYRMDFKIVDFIPNYSVSNGTVYQITGVLNVDNLFINDSRAYSQKTSFQLLKEFAKISGLGFASNIDSTDDSMTWINHSLQNMEFCQRVTEHGYKSDDAFMNSYIDFYYNLTYIDVETQLRQSSDQSITQGVYGLPAGYIRGSTLPDPQQLVLTNNENARTSENYFEKYTVFFKSTNISLYNGYQRIVSMYDRRGHWDGDNKSGKFWKFTVDSITTPGEEKNKIILKGSPQNPQFYKNHKTYTILGKLDQDCTHRNYDYIKIQNAQNLIDLNKITVVIELSKLNFNLYKYMRVKLAFTNQSSQNINSARASNEALSGDWLITGIEILWKQTGVTHKITLVKRELDTPSVSQNDNTNLSTSNNNTNPITATNNQISNDQLANNNNTSLLGNTTPPLNSPITPAQSITTLNNVSNTGFTQASEEAQKLIP